MQKRVALVGFPDDEATAKIIAKKIGVDEVALFPASRDGMTAAATFVVTGPQKNGATPEDLSKNMFIVNSGASQAFIDACRMVRSTGVAFKTAPAPARMRTGDGYGRTLLVAENGSSAPTPAPRPVASPPARPPAPQLHSAATPAPAPRPVPTQPTVVPPQARPTPEQRPRPVAQQTSRTDDQEQYFSDLPLVSDPPLVNGFAPYQAELSPQDRMAQIATEIAHSSFGSLAFRPMTADNRSFLMWVTGVAGGSGKTTLSYLIGNIFASAMKRAGKINDHPVFVIEADFENSKWASRLDIPRGNDISHYVQQMRAMTTDSKTSSPERFRKMKEDAIDGSTFMLDSGLRVIACPYEIEADDVVPISNAIGQIIEFLLNLKGIQPIIIVDGSVPKTSDPVAKAMASLAHATVLTSSRGNNDDVDRALKIMKSQLKMSTSRISLFFMKCTEKRFEDYIARFAPVACAGFLPIIAELEDQSGEHGAWVGNLQEGEVLQRTLLNVAQAVESIHHFNEIKEWDHFVRSQNYSTRGNSVLQIFRRRRR